MIGKMKVVRTSLDMVVYVPTGFGGLGQPHIYEDQTIDHITTILQHGHSPTIRGLPNNKRKLDLYFSGASCNRIRPSRRSYGISNT